MRGWWAIALVAAGIAVPAAARAADTVPAETGKFLTFCRPDRDTVEFIQCAGRIGLVDGQRACSIPNTMSIGETVEPVLSWLRQHPESHGLATDEGIKQALDGLWPCKQ